MINCLLVVIILKTKTKNNILFLLTTYSHFIQKIRSAFALLIKFRLYTF